MYVSQLLQLAPITAVLLVIAAGALGAFGGSQFTRLARKRVLGSVAPRGRSCCPHCGHDLSVGDTIPVLSWIMLRGRCRHCGARISIRYIAAEITTAIAFICMIWCYGLTVQGLALCVLMCVLLAVSLADLEARIIPNVFVLLGVVVWVVVYALAALSCTGVLPQAYTDFCTLGVIEGTLPNPLYGTQGVLLGSLFLPITGNAAAAVLLDGIAGGLGISILMVVLSLVMDRLTGTQNLGAGDIKLLFVTGLYLGLAGNVLNLMLSCILGAAFGLAHARMQGEDAGSAFPFGPAIAASTFLCLVFGPLVLGAM